MTLSPEVAAILRQALNEADHLSGYDDRKAFRVLAEAVGNLLTPLADAPTPTAIAAMWADHLARLKDEDVAF